MSTEFSKVLEAIRPTGDGMLEVVVPADWLQGRTVFGGMQMALAARAMRASLPDSLRNLPLRSAQMTFVGPLLGGETAQLHGQALRQGKSTAHARCDLIQQGQVVCTVTGIFGGGRSSQFMREMPRPAVERAPGQVEPATLVPRFTQHFELRWAVGGAPYSGHPDPHSLIYARLRDRECGAEDALLALADVIPTPVLSMLQPPALASSLNWMIEVLRDPATLDWHDWALIETEVRAGTDGYVSQTSVLYGPDGHAYSVSHQTVGVYG